MRIAAIGTGYVEWSRARGTTCARARPRSAWDGGGAQADAGARDRPEQYSCLDGVDAAVILKEWDQFRALDLDRVKRTLRSPVVIDLRNIYKPADIAERGFAYVSVRLG
jgi:UDP-glucose 6-dehydrogenase